MFRGRRYRKGAVIIELALLAPLLVMLVLGAIHFGYLFYLYNSLEKCVRDGARYAATRTFVAGDPTSYFNVIRTVTAYGAVGSTTTLVPGLDPNRVTVAVVATGPNNRPNRIRVSISGWQYNGVLSPLFGTVTLNGKPALEVPFLGYYVPQP